MFRNAKTAQIIAPILAMLLALCAGTAHAQTFSELQQELTTVKLSKTKAVLEKIAATDDEYVLPLFETMLAGNLYYEVTSKKLLVVEKIDGEYQISDLLTGELLSIDRGETKKIKVNNSLRTYLRSGIARIQLTSDDADVRKEAVEALYKKIDKNVFATILELRDQETDLRVQKAMDVLIDMNDAQSANDPAIQIAAIERLSDSLEPAARNVLLRLANQEEKTDVTLAAVAALETIVSKINFYGKVDTIFFGLSLGSVLLLASIGLAITFGVMGVINMAHGEMIMLGAYTTYVVQLLMPNHIDASILVAIPAAFLVSGAMGVVIERGVIQFLHGRPLETLLATFGISLILQQLVRTIFSPLNRQVDTPSWMSGSLEINPVLFITLNRLYIFFFALLVFAALVMILNKTSLGLNVRAVSQNRNMAKAMGIKTAKVDAMTFGLGSGIAGIAGVALSQLTNVGPNLGQSYIIDSFMVVVFGGVGNLLGTLVAAFTLGVANKVFEPITGAVLASILVLVFIILFIQKRPKGLFPQKGRAAE